MSSVPSFSSFPVFDSFPATTSTSSSKSKGKGRSKDQLSDEEEERDTRKRARKDKNKDKEESATRRKHRHDDRDEQGRPAKSKDIKQVEYYNNPDLASGEIATLKAKNANYEVGESSNIPDYKLFSVDKKGDQDVRRYGKPYKGSIPTYRRFGYGHIVGLEGEFKITKETAYTGEGFTVIAGRDYTTAPRLKDRRAVSRITDRHYKRITLASLKPEDRLEAGALQIDDDFVPFASEVSRQEWLDRLEHEEGQDYRSVAGMTATAESSDDDSLGQEEEGGESYDEYLKRKNREFEQHLRQSPSDTSAWLSLVKFQDEVYSSISPDVSRSRRRAVMSSTEKRSLCEVKLAIIERAMSHSGNTDSVDLTLAMLKQGGEIWDTSELMKRWQAALRNRPEEMKLWLAYLTFRQTRASVFSVQEIVDVYADCLMRLGKSARKAALDSQTRQSLEEICLYLFLRVCLMLRQAGFAERALAAFQAIMELNFYLPDRFHSEVHVNEKTQVQALDDLELFWELEVSRFGEDGAQGWRNTIDTAGSYASHDSKSKDAPYTSEDPFVNWASQESRIANTYNRPLRTADPDPRAESDPFSTVLFSDVRSLLFSISGRDSRYQLVYSFLFFLGLPLIPPDTSTTTSLSSDTFLHSDDFAHQSKRQAFWPSQTSEGFLHGLLPFETIGGEPMEPVRTGGMKTPFDSPFRKFPLSPDLLFSGLPKWFSLLDQKEYLAELDLPLIRNVLAQARTVLKDSFLTLAYFSLEASLNAKNAVKIAKRILKDDSKNLLHWDAYARIERSIGNLAAARSVYTNALILSQEFTERERMDTPLLWRAWAEMEWEAGRPTSALTVLFASACDKVDKALLDQAASSEGPPSPSPVQLLRARQFYFRQLELSNSNDSPQSLFRHRISITFCLALLQYLSSDLDAANNVMESQVKHLRSEGKQSAEEEEALALQAKIIFRHTQTRTAFRPGLLRQHLESALSHFPNNSIFLSMFLFNEMRTRIEGRVKKVLNDVTLSKDSATTESWLFAIYSELHMNGRNYNAQAVRALFERAIDSDGTSSSVSIWSLYIDYELRQNQPTRAKGLLQRALAQCPWAKSLYLMAFSANFRPAYRSAELKAIHRLMLEKGVRLYTDLEALVYDYTSDASEDEGDEEEATADALYAQKQATERLKLLPM